MTKLRKVNQVKLSDGSLLSEAITKYKRHFYKEDFSFVDFSNQQLEYLTFKNCNFSHCDFTKASIKDTAFIESDLTKANFTKARLYYNYFYKSNLTDVNFENISVADYEIYRLLRSNSNLTNLKLEQLTGGMKVPFVKDLHKKVYKSVGEEGRFLEMNRWHQHCGMTHCRGGWAIHHAGEAGFELEKKLDPGTAAALIYYKNAGMVPDFHTLNEEALKDIQRCASL